MKRRHLLIVGVLPFVVILFAAWATYPRSTCRLYAVEFERPDGTRFRTEDLDFLRKVEAWHDAIEAPSLRQPWLRLRGAWTESGLRQPDYELTIFFKSGRRDEIAVWVYAEDYVPVYTA